MNFVTHFSETLCVTFEPEYTKWNKQTRFFIAAGVKAG
jgi:hypothetical protein